MKKTLSLILCLLMVFGSFAGALTASAEVTGKNLWTDISVDDFGTKDVDGVIPKFEEGKNNYGKKFTVTDAYHTSFYIEMPELDANTIYDLSFKYDNHIIENKPGKINSVSIVTEEEMAQITDAGGSKLPSTATTIGSALELDKGEYTDLSATFTTGATKTKHYLYFRTGYAYWFYLCDFKLVKVPTYNVTVEGGTADKVEAKAGETVTITATPAKTQAFYYWEVTSGNVELSDTFSKTATFTMPAEDVTVEAVFLDNLWSNISADDWFTRQVSTKVDDPLTLEEKKMTDVYPEKFTYTEDGSFSLQTAGSKFYYVKLPELAKNTEYTLSLDYSATKANASLTPNLYKVILMPESGFTNQYTWNGYGDMLSGRSFLGAYDVCLNKALSENELNSTLTYDFNSKTKTQYYLFFHFSNIGNITYSNFKLTECPLYGITVDGGTASLTSAKKGAEVTITANEPQNGMVFDHFEVVSGGVTLADPYSPTTTFTMGNFGVNIKAVYREYGAKIVYLNTDGTPYADSANIGGAKIEITENSDGTETITLSYDKMDNVNTFIGWYKGEELLEKGESFTYNPEETDISTLSAKIITRNVLMGAAGFESYSNNTSLRVEPVATGVLPYDERWGLIQGSNYEAENIGFYIKTTEAKQSTYYTDIGFDPETSTNAPEADRKVAKFDVAPYSGNSMLELSAAYRSFVRKIDGLKPNTNYTLSMYVLTPDEYNFLSSAVIANGYTERPSRLQVMSKQMIKSSKLKIYGFYEEPRTQELFEVNVTPKDKSAIRNWKKISFNFTTDNNTDSIYLYLNPRCKTTWYNRCQIFIDNMVLVENELRNQGNAMRAASAETPQALRYKFAVDNELLSSYKGYTFKNMGVLAADSSKITNNMLVKGNENVKDVLITEANYQYKEGDDQNTYVTAALYNIGKNGGKIDFAKYANNYIVRPYIVYENEAGAEYVLYGENISASIFDVMYAIRHEATNADDLSVVNGILEDKTVLSAYCNWQPDDGWNIVNPNPPTEYDYSFAVVGDIQYTTALYPEMLPYTFNWLIDNKENSKLQYVFNTGDITDHSYDSEYEDISKYLLSLKEAGINQSVVRGNHDKIAGYDKHITTERFSYGGEFESYDGSMKTYYRKITIGGIKYMMLTLDFFPCTAEVNWAKQKIEANPDYNVIINTHGYLDGNMQLLGESEVYGVDDRVDENGNPLGGHAGQYIYDNLVLPCSNVVMVICGHESSYGPEIKTITRADGSTAVQMLVDFQQEEYLDLRSYGMLAMLYFSDGGETVTVEWFSTIKNEYYMDKYQYSFKLNVIK